MTRGNPRRSSPPGKVMLWRLHPRTEKSCIALGRRPSATHHTSTYQTGSQRRVLMPEIYTSRAGDTRALRGCVCTRYSPNQTRWENKIKKERGSAILVAAVFNLLTHGISISWYGSNAIWGGLQYIRGTGLFGEQGTWAGRSSPEGAK